MLGQFPPSLAPTLGQTPPPLHLIPGDGDMPNSVIKHRPLHRRCAPSGTEGDFAPDIPAYVPAHLRSRPLLRRVTVPRINPVEAGEKSSIIEKVRRANAVLVESVINSLTMQSILGDNPASDVQDDGSALTDPSDASDYVISRQRMREAWLEFVHLTQVYSGYYYEKYMGSKREVENLQKVNDGLGNEIGRLRSELCESREKLDELQRGFESFATKFASLK